jgi:hypothetical protein
MMQESAQCLLVLLLSPLERGELYDPLRWISLSKKTRPVQVCDENEQPAAVRRLQVRIRLVSAIPFPRLS